MSDPANIPPSSGPSIKIPAAGGAQPPTNPKKQTVRITLPPEQPIPPTEEEKEERRFTLKPQKRTLVERWKDLTPPTKKKIKILVLCVIGITGIALLFNPAKESYMEWAEKRKVEASYKELLKGKEEELQKTKTSLEELKLKAKIDAEEWKLKVKKEKTEKETLADNFSKLSVPEKLTNFVIVQKTNYVSVAKDDNSSFGPEKGEYIFPGLKGQIPVPGMDSIEIEKGVTPGNGTRFYIPKGWKIRYKYYCSTEDFEVFVNKGTREIPTWIPISVQDSRISESLWIRNKTSKGLIFTFILNTLE